MTKPKFSWSEDYLTDLENELGSDGRQVICLSPVSFRVLADMSAMILWPTRWGLQAADNLPAMAHNIYKELNTPMSCEDFLQAIRDMTINVNVASGGGGVTLVCNGYPTNEEEWGTIPEEVTPADTPEPTAPTYADYKCKASHLVGDLLFNIVDNFETAMLEQSPFDTFTDWLATVWYGTASRNRLTAVFAYVMGIIYNGYFQALADYYDTIKNDIVCAIYAADTPAGATTAMLDIIMSGDASYAVRYGLRLLLEFKDLSSVWVDGELDTTGYESVTCDCLPAGWQLTPVPFDGTVDQSEFAGWNVTGHEISVTGARTKNNAQTLFNIDGTGLPAVTLTDGDIGIRALLVECVAATNNQGYFHDDGLWYSSTKIFSAGETIVLKWRESSNQQVTAQDLQDLMTAQGWSSTFGPTGVKIPIDWTDQHISVYSYDDDGPFTYRLWFIERTA